MLYVLQEWCYTWRMCVNEAKTQVVHFRSIQTPCTHDEQLDITHIANTWSVTGSRALGGILHKYFNIHGIMGMQFKVLKTRTHCVIPVMNYGSELWATNATNNLKLSCISLYILD